MATNTLVSSAAEVDSQVEPATKFFDPSASLGIMQRYGMSGQSRAFAEDALKSANEIDQAVNYDPINRRNDLERHDWAREAKDKADLAYDEKKNFETTLGTFLVDFARLDENADDFDEKLTQFISDPRALNNEAVRSIYNLKVGQREQASRQKEVAGSRNNAVLESWSQSGYDPADITNDAGMFDPTKAAKARQKESAEVMQSKAAEKGREERLVLYNGDRDVADATTVEQVEPIFKIRSKVFLESGAPLAISTTPTAEGQPSEFDILNNEAPGLTAEQYVARLIKYDIPEADLTGLNETERVIKLMSKGGDTKDPSLATAAKAALGMWSAAHARGRLPKAPNKKVPDATTGATNDAATGAAAPPAASKPQANPRADKYL
jgi:hypothetical protein